MRNIDYGPMPLSCIVLLLFAVFPYGANASEDLWDLLREGGKVVLMRHAPVERGAGTGDPLARDPSCRIEKNLSQQGRRDAEAVGRRFSENKVPVSSVMHSPFCRTTDTAQLAFGRASPADYLSLLEVLDPDEAARQTDVLNQVVGSYAGDGNLVLVTHEPNIRAVSFELMGHLDFLVAEPMGDGEFEELGVLRFSN